MPLALTVTLPCDTLPTLWMEMVPLPSASESFASTGMTTLNPWTTLAESGRATGGWLLLTTSQVNVSSSDSEPSLALTVTV